MLQFQPEVFGLAHAYAQYEKWPGLDAFDFQSVWPMVITTVGYLRISLNLLFICSKYCTIDFGQTLKQLPLLTHRSSRAPSTN